MGKATASLGTAPARIVEARGNVLGTHRAARRPRLGARDGEIQNQSKEFRRLSWQRVSGDDDAAIVGGDLTVRKTDAVFETEPRIDLERQRLAI